MREIEKAKSKMIVKMKKQSQNPSKKAQKMTKPDFFRLSGYCGGRTWLVNEQVGNWPTALIV